MPVTHVLAVVPVTDLDVARRWYTALFGRPADNNPMPTLVEWQVVPSGWVQVFCDPDRAGGATVNLAVDDLEAHGAELEGRGLHPDDVVDADKGVQLCALHDPDGNVVTLIGGFRVEY